MADFKKIGSVQDLRDLFLDEHGELKVFECAECFVQLNGCRSWKTIGFDGENEWYVLNEIDETEEYLTTEELTKSIIGEAMEKGAFYFAWF